MGAAIDLTGQRFERLVVINRAGINKSGSYKWNCVCDCGNTKVVESGHLRQGKTQSCGCLQRELAAERASKLHKGNKYCLKHGLRFHPLYHTWASIKDRTTNPNHSSFKNYGGRGIKIHPTWENDLKAFITWILDNLGDRPQGMTLDRINNDVGYEPGNLRWATWSEQRLNQRRTTQTTNPMETV